MKVLETYYGWCGVTTWQEAETLAGTELLDEMDFVNIQHLSKKDAIFPFDFIAEKRDEKYLIDVTLRIRKPVRTKRLDVWRALGYRTTVLCILPPERRLAILLEIDAGDRSVGVSPTMINNCERELDDFFHQKTLREIS